MGHERNKTRYKILVGNYGGRISLGSFKLGGSDLLK
jgi:hypothetical protein